MGVRGVKGVTVVVHSLRDRAYWEKLKPKSMVNISGVGESIWIDFKVKSYLIQRLNIVCIGLIDLIFLDILLHIYIISRIKIISYIKQNLFFE